MQFRRKYLKNQIELLMTSHIDREFWTRNKKCTRHKILQFRQDNVDSFFSLVFIIYHPEDEKDKLEFSLGVGSLTNPLSRSDAFKAFA